jgi:hypothetical protein
MVNERFLCNDSGWQAAVIAQPPEGTIDKGISSRFLFT